jgi:hypothetical protein
MRSKVFTGKALGCQQKKYGAGKNPSGEFGASKKKRKNVRQPA